MLELYALSLSEDISDERARQWQEMIPEERKERLLRYRFREDFLRSLAGEAVARMLIGEKRGLLPQDVAIAHPAMGKPYLTDIADLHFNISHSGDWVVCAIADMPVGVDIEEIREDRVTPALMEKVLSEKEREYLASCHATERSQVFYRYWTLKEAYAKYTGEGLGGVAAHIEVDMRSSPIALYDGKEIFTGGLHEMADIDGCAAAVCVEKRIAEGLPRGFVRFTEVAM